MVAIFVALLILALVAVDSGIERRKRRTRRLVHRPSPTTAGES
jgi:hypothetical protein